MIAAMLVCPACGGERPRQDMPCSSCGGAPMSGGRLAGTSEASSFEGITVPDLDLPRGGRPNARLPIRAGEPEMSIELAVDAMALVRERSSATASVGDLVFDARLLADYGEPHRNWLLWPLYSWRVFWRRRELRRALLVRREEARRTAQEVDDALVAIAEQTRPIVQGEKAFETAIENLRQAEGLLRSRDQVFAAEQDAQNARLAQVDARLRALDADLANAQAEERGIAAELGAAQATVAREEAAHKRAAPRSGGAEGSGG